MVASWIVSHNQNLTCTGWDITKNLVASDGISGRLAGGYLANYLDTSNQSRMVPQTYPLNLANNRFEIAFSVLSLGGWKLKLELSQPNQLSWRWIDLDWAWQNCELYCTCQDILRKTVLSNNSDHLLKIFIAKESCEQWLCMFVVNISAKKRFLTKVEQLWITIFQQQMWTSVLNIICEQKL